MYLLAYGESDDPGCDDASDAIQERWMNFAEVLADACDRELETTWERITEKAYAAYHENEGYGEQPLVVRLLWQAVTRHIVNLITAEDAEDLSALSGAGKFWKEWILERSSKNAEDVGPQQLDGVGRTSKDEDEGEDYG